MWRAFLSLLRERIGYGTIIAVLLELPGNNPMAVMGHPDNLKLLSSMTLFAQITGKDSIFHLSTDVNIRNVRKISYTA